MTKSGQINRGSLLGEHIYKICCQCDIRTIFEIGTWNGLGTTKCIRDAIMDSGKEDYITETEAEIKKKNERGYHYERLK